MSYNRIVISSGHGKYVRGASGIIDEVDEARRVVEHLADELRDRDVDVKVFHDDTSHFAEREPQHDRRLSQRADARPRCQRALQRL